MNNTTEFIIDDGLKEYTFKNPLGEVFARFKFNPADTGIIDRYEKVIEFFKTASYGSDLSEVQKLDADIKEQFNILCGRNVADGLFMCCNPLTLFANGDLYAEVALEYIGKIIGAEMDERVNLKKARIRNDIAKNRQ